MIGFDDGSFHLIRLDTKQPNHIEPLRPLN